MSTFFSRLTLALTKLQSNRISSSITPPGPQPGPPGPEPDENGSFSKSFSISFSGGQSQTSP